ncbi:MAG: U32 family peptidase [Desulfobulbaceae bacterium]|nr:U32 family peptidase [Desulfobulbaceae bacterium]
MELLAPAGSFPAFEAALEAGADSIYVGVPGFNARALSRDFTFAEIDSMIRQAHGQGVKVYIAMNSLVKESELPAALDALSCLEQLRPDALILQDLGLLYIARTWFPDLSLHASTLMSIHNSTAAMELTNLGVERVVLARELTIEEMAEIHQKTDAEIEVFIHGAMCFSYSGLCMFSSLHGGKSSLRGQCVQPCRRHYSWQAPGKTQRDGGREKDTKYLFSMNDLCGVDFLPALRDAGVSCLKIEGRMKSARYVANTVAAYRMALDSMDEPVEEQGRILNEAHKLLDEAMARKRSSGFLLADRPTGAITPQQSGNSGQLLGQVRGVQQERTRDGKNQLTLQIRLQGQVSEGDRLRLHNEKTGERISFTLRYLQIGGQRRKAGSSGQNAQLSLGADLKGRSGRNFRGSLFKVDVGSRIVAERTGRKRSKKLSGRKIFADKRKVEEILNHLSWKRGDGKAKHSARRKGAPEDSRAGRRGSRKELPWWVAVSAVADVRQRLPVRAARILLPLTRDNMRSLDQLGAKIKKYRGRIIWRLPPIIHEADLDWYVEQVRQLATTGYSRFELGHCSQYGLFTSLQDGKHQQRLELYGQYSLNLLNSAALRAAGYLGFQGGLFSLESEAENLTAAISHFKRQRGRGRPQQRMKVGLYVYGRPPLFTARLDSDQYNYRRQIVSPKDEQYTLEHKNGLTLARATLPFSLLRWQRELTTMGLDYLLLDLTGGPIRKEAAAASALLAGGGKRIPVLSGNFQGTLV